MKIQRMISMEFLGTAILAVAIVGSGHMAINLQADSGMVLLINALATAIGLALVIRIGMKVSGSHFNPAVTLVMLMLKKITPQLSLFYITAQIVGAITGVGFANLLFDQKALDQSSIERSGSNLFFSEIFATAVLLWIILRFPKRDDLIAVYVPLWIFGAILFTSSTSFANPAITIGRIFTNSVVGIAPESVVAFILAQLIGAGLGLLAAKNITNASKEGNE
ncbi:MAG: aquaporin [Candidatus Nanopelagicus sp.]|nr:aquaporin [Candidatus Nanopelagicus sp.]